MIEGHKLKRVKSLSSSLAQIPFSQYLCVCLKPININLPNSELIVLTEERSKQERHRDANDLTNA